MQHRYHLPILLLTLCLLHTAAQAQTFFTARLTAPQAGVDGLENAHGTAAMVLTDSELRYFITVDGLSGAVASAHFHTGAYGEDGGVVHPIEFVGNRAEGTWSRSGEGALSDEMLDALMLGKLYVNVHTGVNPAGEIRGQVLPTSGTSLTAALTPEQETNGVESDGSGTAALQLTDEGLIYHITVDELTGDVQAAHFHFGPAGVSGGVVRGVTFDGTQSAGIWRASDSEPLVDSLVTHLLLGNLYLNVHTGSYPAGEIRGQVLVNDGIGFHAHMDASQQSDEVNSDGTGTGTFTLTDAGLIYRITVADLTGDIQAAHFHEGAAGANGGVVHPINFSGNTAAGVWRTKADPALTPERIDQLLQGSLYVNVHTPDHPAGEIRGQVERTTGTSMAGRLSDRQSGTMTGGTGTAALALTDGGLDYHITVAGLSGNIAAAHFHVGSLGVGGGVEHPINFQNGTASGQWPRNELSDEQLATLLTGGLYINVHTPDNPAGEIRGQVTLSAGAGFSAMLTNEQQSADVTQDGGGTASLTFTDAGVVYRATVANLTGPIGAAHFHNAQPGQDSGIAHTVSFEGATASGAWLPSSSEPLTDERVLELTSGGLYLNVHTAQHGPGEIRGQVELSGGIGRAVEMGPESNDVVTSGHGAASVTLTGAGLIYRASVSELTGDIQAAHFHQAPLGMGGGVVHGVEFDGTHLAGIWRASDSQPLDMSALRGFFADELYLNVHTPDNPAGEVRGQLDQEYDTLPTSAEPDSDLPFSIGLGQNYPNPFNPSTIIPFTVDHAASVRLEIFDALGRLVTTVFDGPLQAGSHNVTFDGRGLPAGTYFYRITTDKTTALRAMTLLP